MYTGFVYMNAYVYIYIHILNEYVYIYICSHNCEVIFIVALLIIATNQRLLQHLLIGDWLNKVCSFTGFLCNP